MLTLAGSLGCRRTPADDEAGGAGVELERRDVLASLAENVFVPTYVELSATSATLRDSTSLWRDAVAAGDPDLGTHRDAAREAFREAMRAVQRAELLQVGPAGQAGSTTGGLSLRDAIYSWPLSNPCAIDEQLVAESYAAPTFLAEAPVTLKGAAALEVLLFSEDGASHCAADHVIQDDWALLTLEELEQRRSVYAATTAAALVDDADRLLEAWQPGGGDFAANIASAGEGSSAFGSAQDALNELFAALYYVELVVKDKKLAIPAGISAACPTTTCPERGESRFADIGLQNIVENLRSAQAIFLGQRAGDATERLGFDDLLVDAGAAELAANMSAALQNVIDVAAALPSSLTEALATNHLGVVALYDALKAFTDLFKVDFVSALDLRVPEQGAGDND